MKNTFKYKILYNGLWSGIKSQKEPVMCQNFIIKIGDNLDIILLSSMSFHKCLLSKDNEMSQIFIYFYMIFIKRTYSVYHIVTSNFWNKNFYINNFIQILTK